MLIELDTVGMVDHLGFKSKGSAARPSKGHRSSSATRLMNFSSSLGSNDRNILSLSIDVHTNFANRKNYWTAVTAS